MSFDYDVKLYFFNEDGTVSQDGMTRNPFKKFISTYDKDGNSSITVLDYYDDIKVIEIYTQSATIYCYLDTKTRGGIKQWLKDIKDIKHLIR